MALIACKECAREISDKAPACPGCGAPVLGNELPTKAAEPKPKRKTSPVAWIALVLAVVGGGWYFQSRGYKEQWLPPMPVEVSQRPAITGPGMVLRVSNRSDDFITVLVDLNNPTTNDSRSFRLDIKPGSSSEIGHREGWVLANGDHVTIRNEAFRSWSGTI